MRFSMGQETNIESIRALEKQIAEGKGDIIKLKRIRNSLLNISARVPPEILGSIFAWVVARRRDFSLHSLAHFAGIEKGSYTFRLVCHHWYDVASKTPEVWAFWGKTLEKWDSWFYRSRATPIDLVLERSADNPGTFNVHLRIALRDRATRDEIRQIHLLADKPYLLAPTFSCLTPDGEDTREMHVESIIVRAETIPAELSTFFARSRLPNLRSLQINVYGNLTTPSYFSAYGRPQRLLWENLPLPPFTRLISLSLRAEQQLSITASQLTSILTSNPNLQELDLSYSALPSDVDAPGVRIPLLRLREIHLAGKARRLFWLLNLLELPSALDSVGITIEDFTTEDILQTLGPYMRDHFRRDIRFQGRLDVVIIIDSGGDVHVNDGLYGELELTVEPEESLRSTYFSVSLLAPAPLDPATESLFLDLVTFIPPERVVALETEYCTYSAKLPEDLLVAMPIEKLYLQAPTLSDGFLQPDPNGPHAKTGLFPSLQFLRLETLAMRDVDWEPLVKYLAHRTPDNQAVSLMVTECPRMPPEVEKEIRGLVGTFFYDPYPEREDGEDEDKGGDSEGSELEDEEAGR